MNILSKNLLHYNEKARWLFSLQSPNIIFRLVNFGELFKYAVFPWTFYVGLLRF